MCKTQNDIENFFSKTFYAFQYGDIDSLLSKVDKILANLYEWNFITINNDEVKPTILGKRVSELYIDPLSAYTIINTLRDREEINNLALLHLMSRCIEMRPLLNVRQSEIYRIEEEIAKMEDILFFDVPEQWDWEYEHFLKEIKTALLFNAWINEASEEEILENFNVTPGELRGRLEIADWLLYSMQELMLLVRQMELIKHIRKLRLRIQHGVKEDVLPLVRLRGIGRVRARKLANAGIKTITKLREVPLATLEFLVGPKIAQEIKKQITG
jgi:helicase